VKSNKQLRDQNINVFEVLKKPYKRFGQNKLFFYFQTKECFYLRSQTNLLKLAQVKVEERMPTPPHQHKLVHNFWMLFNDVNGLRGAVWYSFAGGTGSM